MDLVFFVGNSDWNQSVIRRGHRVPYKRQQTTELEKEFLVNQYPERQRRLAIAKALRLTERQVRKIQYSLTHENLENYLTLSRHHLVLPQQTDSIVVWCGLESIQNE